MDTSRFSKKEMRYLLRHSALRLKTLACSPLGDYHLMDHADRVIEDIFDYHHICRQLKMVDSDNQAFRVMSAFGMDRILTLTMNEVYFGALYDLVRMDAELASLKKQRRKLSRKGKNCPKALAKEIKYFEEQYQKGCKALRKTFGMSKKETAYKSKFTGVQRLIEKREHRDYGGNGYFDMLDDEMEDEEFSTEDAVAEFMEKLGSVSGKKSSPQKHSRRSILEDLEDDDDDDDELDDDELDEVDDTTLRLMRNVTDLTRVVQGLVNNQPTTVPPSIFPTPVNPNESPDLRAILNEVQKIGENQNDLRSQLTRMREDTDDIIGYLCAEDDEEDDDSDIAELMSTRSPIEVVQHLLQDKDLSSYDRQRLIQELNRLKAKEASDREDARVAPEEEPEVVEEVEASGSIIEVSEMRVEVTEPDAAQTFNHPQE